MDLWNSRKLSDAIFIGCFFVLSLAIKLFLGGLSYDLLWAFLAKHNIKEADVIAYILSNFAPVLLAAATIGVMYLTKRVVTNNRISIDRRVSSSVTTEQTVIRAGRDHKDDNAT